MNDEEKNKKLNQKFKNIYSPKILSASWEKDGMEVSNIIIKYIFIIKDNFQKR